MTNPLRKTKRIPFTGNEPILYSAEAEKAILASMLCYPKETIDEVILNLEVTDFYVVSHQELLKAMVALYEADSGIDITTVHQYLVDKGLADMVGSPGILAELLAGNSSAVNLSTYIKVVKEKMMLRTLHDACEEIKRMTIENQDEADKVISEAERRVFEVGDRTQEETIRPFGEAIKAECERINALDGKTLVGLHTPFPKLTKLTTGWRKEDLIILGARPSVGKSALMITIIRKLIRSWKREGDETWYRGTPVGCFSLEMSQDSLCDRILAMHSWIDLQHIRSGTLDESQKKKLAAKAEEMSYWPLVIDETSALDISQIRARARRMKRTHDIKLILIDYLQLIRCKAVRAKKDNRQEEVAEISRNLKQMQRELGIPIICLAQLNRLSSEDEEPQLHHLRESGAIEQDADIVLLLHRMPDSGKEYKPYKLIVAKQRNGPTGVVNLEFLPFRTLFKEAEDIADNY